MTASTSKQILLAALLFQLPFLKKVSGETCETQPKSNLFRPSTLLDQHFGLVLDPDDFFEPLILPRWLSRSAAGYLRPWRSDASRIDTGSTVSFDKDKFQANLDVQQFKPDEISVKLNENILTVEGKHEEKQDEHGYISRHFIRRYELPKNCDVSKVESRLSSDGVLTITAPTVNAKEIDYKEIPIQQTGQPARIEKKENSEKEARNEL